DNLFRGHVELFTELFRCGFPPQVLEHLTLYAGELVNHFDHMHWNTNGARLIRHRSRNSLTNPPGGVGREFEALGVVKLFNRTNQPQVSLLDEVEELHSSTGVAFCQRDNETQVRSKE